MATSKEEARRGSATPAFPGLNPGALRLAIETVEESPADIGRQLSPGRKTGMAAAACGLFVDGEGKIERRTSCCAW